MWRPFCTAVSGQGRRRTDGWRKCEGEGKWMQKGRINNRSPVHIAESRRYAPDKPKECRHCYFWKEKKKECSRKECYYLLPEESKESGAVQENLPVQEPAERGNCQCCPYGRHSPCIGYCIQKIIWEMKEKRQAAGKEGNGIAGRSK